MKKIQKISFTLGCGGLTFLVIAYFIPILDDSGANYVVYDSLLGILIFHNVVVLWLYGVVGFALIAWGLRRYVRV